MASAFFNQNSKVSPRRHPFGAHGVLLALPLSVALWVLLALPFI